MGSGSRRAGVSGGVSGGESGGGGGRGGGLSFLAAGLVLLVAVMASVMRVPLKPEVVSPGGSGEVFMPPVPLDEMSDYHLRTMPFPDLFRLFNTLEAPAEPLDGEYLAEMLE